MKSRQQRARLGALIDRLSIGGLGLVTAALVVLVIWGATHGSQLD